MCPVLHKLQIGFGVIEVTARCKDQGPSFVQRTIVMSMLVQQYNKSWTAEHKTFEWKTKRFYVFAGVIKWNWPTVQY